MWPQADVPVLQVSQPSLDPAVLYDLGERLAPLRDEDVLIYATGLLTHGAVAGALEAGPELTPPQWSVDFDQWVCEAVHGRDLDTLFAWQTKAPGARDAHPTVEHFTPLFVTLGAASIDDTVSSPIEGFWYGSSMRSLQFG